MSAILCSWKWKFGLHRRRWIVQSSCCLFCHLPQFVIASVDTHCPLEEIKCLLMLGLQVTANSQLDTILSLQKCRNRGSPKSLLQAHVLSLQRGLLSLSHTTTHPLPLKPALNQSTNTCLVVDELGPTVLVLVALCLITLLSMRHGCLHMHASSLYNASVTYTLILT